ncbi:hypothetical protein [Holospora undulata]|uniref:hypothetical protein n=1 Tax=Holospora undulata TaxID=1169117 RepID=UPI001F35404D|nr:hypothetical protein [Holospora undulata]
MDTEEFPDRCYERAKSLEVSASGIRYAKHRLGETYKKTLNHPIQRRSMFCQKIEELKKEDKQIGYSDESGFAHDIPRTHGHY